MLLGGEQLNIMLLLVVHVWEGERGKQALLVGRLHLSFRLKKASPDVRQSLSQSLPFQCVVVGVRVQEALNPVAVGSPGTVTTTVIKAATIRGH
jgi:hypothetical protein